MSGNSTSNTSAIIRAQVYSDIILDEIKDNFLPEGLHRDVSDFGDGDTLHIPTFGEVVLRDLSEDNDTPVDAIDTGQVTLSITEHVGAGSYLTDKLKQDSYKAAQFDAAIVPKHLRAVKERYETDLLATVNDQTSADPNTINGTAHRFIASGSNQVITVADLVYLKLVFDKAQLPDEGRILIVDPLVEATLNNLTNLVNVSNNPQFTGIIETGFGKNMRFIKNVFGFDIYVSNRLPRVTSESIDTSSIDIPAPSGSSSVTGGIVNVAMCVADDMTTPIMGAWRQMPMTEGYRNVQKRRDEFYTTARWGFGLQRKQAIVGILTSDSNY
jgi:hypothetical protein